MVELAIYPNPRIDQTLLFDGIQSYSNKLNKPVNMRILEAEIISNPQDEDQDMLQLFLEIRTYQFNCKAYKMEDGILDKSQTVRVKASWETVRICYDLEKEDGSNYRVERNNPLFNLLNYALQHRNRVMPGNKQGFKNVSYSEMTSALNGLNFGAMVKTQYGEPVLFAIDFDQWEEMQTRRY